MPPVSWSLDDLKAVVARHWGFSSLRPLQEQAMRAVLDGRDSLVVLPTGGGKSLCYQAPAVLRGGTTVVVSPLIALMKDQVDGLRACGVAAVQIDSSLSDSERFAAEMDLATGRHPPAVRLAGTAGVSPTSTACCSRSASTPSPSTRPTASATGATISAPNIASSPASASSSPAPPSTPTPPPPPSRSAATSSPSSPCATPSCWSATSIGPI